jgi:uncharacterized protein (DUF362 family)
MYSPPPRAVTIQQSGSEWLETPQALDAVLSDVLRHDMSTTIDCRAQNSLTGLTLNLDTFLMEQYAGGYVVVKTSTAGNRSSAHEASTALLTHVLQRAKRTIAPGRIVLADGPGFPVTYESECKRLGWDSLARSLDVSISDLNSGPTIEVAPGWPASRLYLQADLIINLTKAKTHRRFGVSLAEKSLLGTLSGSVLGYPKLSGKHSMTPWLLREIQAKSPPIFSIIDGVEGIEGEGPLNGRTVDSQFLSFGIGCIAPDLRATVEMGFDPVLIPLWHRPWPRVNELAINWAKIRVTGTDFLPSTSCSWLYKSLRQSKRRMPNYTMLMEGARACWPNKM